MPRTAAALTALLLASPGFADQSPIPPPVAAPEPVAPPGNAAAAPQEPGAARPLPARPPSQPLPRGAVLEEVSGVLEQVDPRTHRITVSTSGGPVTLSVDRNTMVYTAGGLGTVLDLVPGSQLRAGRNADALAYWVQVRRAPGQAEPASPPGQGTGPGGGSGPPAEGGASGRTTAPAGTGIAPGPAAPPSGVPAR